MKHPLTAARIQEALADKGMTAKELSNATGVSQASLSQYINGSHVPSSFSSKKIADVLEVDPLWLMGFDVSKKNETSRLLRYREKLAALSPELQEKVFSYIDAITDLTKE